MRCENAREKFSPLLDGELAPIEWESMHQHLATCPDCQADLDTWQGISASLKDLAQSYTAPAGFSASVLGQLQTPGRQKSISYTNIRRWAASAAAAALILAGSSAGLAYHYYNGPAPSAVNQPGPPSIAANPAANPVPELPVNPGNEGTVSPSTQAVVPPSSTDSSKKPDAPSEPVMIAQSTMQPKVFLSTDRVITTTMLKLRVKDPGAAYQQAVAAGQSASASTQILAQQAGEKYVIKFVVTVKQVPSLLDGLGRLGTTLEQVTDKQDVTANFSDTLETYGEVVSQLNATTDVGQQKELTERARYLENLLSTWDKESSKRVIVLWIES